MVLIAPSWRSRTHAGQTERQPAEQRPTTGYQANWQKVNEIMEFFCQSDPNAVRYATTVVRWSGLSCGSPARAPSSPVSCRPAKAVLRHGFSRSRSTGRQNDLLLLSPRADRRTSGNLTVGCQLLRQRQKANRGVELKIESYYQQRT